MPRPTLAQKKSNNLPNYGHLTPIAAYMGAFATTPKMRGQFDAMSHGVVPPFLRSLSRFKHILQTPSTAASSSSSPSSLLVTLHPKAEAAAIEVSNPYRVVQSLRKACPGVIVESASINPWSGSMRSSLFGGKEATVRLREQAFARKKSSELVSFGSQSGSCCRQKDGVDKRINDTFDTLEGALAVSSRVHLCGDADCSRFLVPFCGLNIMTENPFSLKACTLLLCNVGPYKKYLNSLAMNKMKKGVATPVPIGFCKTQVSPFKFGTSPTFFTGDRPFYVYELALFPYSLELFATLLDGMVAANIINSSISKVTLLCAASSANTIITDPSMFTKLAALTNIKVCASKSFGALAGVIVNKQRDVISTLATSCGLGFKADDLISAFETVPRLHVLSKGTMTCGDGDVSIFGCHSTNNNAFSAPTRHAVVNQNSALFAELAVPVYGCWC